VGSLVRQGVFVFALFADVRVFFFDGGDWDELLQSRRGWGAVVLRCMVRGRIEGRSCWCLGTLPLPWNYLAHAHVLIINLDLRVVGNISQMTALRTKARLSIIGDGSFLSRYIQ